MAVKAIQVGVENDCATEDRRDADHTLLHSFVPKLKLATEVIGPILVQIDQQVQSPLNAQPTVNVKIGVNAEVAAALGLVETSSVEVRIGEEARDPCKFFEKAQKCLAVELGKEVLDQTGGYFSRRELKLEPLLVPVKKRLAFVRRELSENAAKHLFVQEVVHNNVWKRHRC